MDKIKKRKRERVNDDTWIEAHWNIDDVADKLNKLVGGYNEMMKWRDRYCNKVRCGQCNKIIPQTDCYKDDKPICVKCWYE